MLSVPREKYPEMNWRAADKVAAWKTFKRRMKHDLRGRPDTRGEASGALILVAGGGQSLQLLGHS